MKFIILGSSNAIPDKHHENTHMAITSKDRVILIDCGNSPTLRLRQVGISLDNLSDIILTHFHPDHISGFPTLLMNMWLLGRSAPLNIHGLKHTLERVKLMMELFDWDSWPNFFSVRFHVVAEDEMTPVLEGEELKILSSPVQHMIPTIGLRIEQFSNDKVLAYSCDTSPCQTVVGLARGASVLIHESAGNSMGHTSASQAGEIATEAGVERLFLIHYPIGNNSTQKLVEQARTKFTGFVDLAKDFMEIEL